MTMVVGGFRFEKKYNAKTDYQMENAVIDGYMCGTHDECFFISTKKRQSCIE